MASCLGDRKQVRDKRLDSHLTGVRKYGNNNTWGLAIDSKINTQMRHVDNLVPREKPWGRGCHVEKVSSVKTKSTLSTVDFKNLFIG